MLELGLIPMEGNIFGTLWNGIMTPLRWAVSGVLVLWHWLFHSVLGLPQAASWVLSIVFLTIVIRVALIPIFVKQIHSSRNMQLIQPKMRELQEKYRHDRERLGQETMKLYKEEGVNPMASCLPLLLQMPIFFALFEVLNSAARSRDGLGAHGFWLQRDPELVRSLSEATIFGARISDTFLPFTWPFTNVQIVTIILIVLMTATLFFTQKQLMGKNMPPEAMTGPMAQQQKMMLYIFPIIFAVGGVNFPVGVLIYWLTSNLWTAGQQWYIIRANPAPGTPAYEAWEERMIAKGRDPKQIAAERIAKRNKKRKTTTATTSTTESGTGVQRQQPKRQSRADRVGQAPTSTSGTAKSGTSGTQRQQPRRKSRASRQGSAGKKRRS